MGRSASSQIAKISYEQSKTKLENTQQQIKISVKNAKATYELAFENFSIKKSNMDLAENIERKNQTKFSQGMASSFELRQAQKQLFTAQQNYLESLKNLVTKKTELETLLNIYNNQ